MTDDAELRARIEAQVAARRAGRSPARRRHSRAAEDADDAATNPRGGSDPERTGEQPPVATPLAADPTGLSPARPWSRDAAPSPAPPPPPPGDDRGPIRPWLLHGESSLHSAQSAHSAGPSAPVHPSSGGLAPARPWQHTGTDPGDPAPPTPTPSHPETVLRDLVAGLAVESAGEPEAAGLSYRTPEPVAAPDREEAPRAGAAEADEQAGEHLGEDVDDRPARRALRWLLARAPEPAAPPAATDPEPGSPPRHLPRAVPAADPALAAPAAPAASDEPMPFAPKRPTLARLFNRRLDEDDEADEPFTLPEPDAVFERPWRQAPEPGTPTPSVASPIPPPAAPAPIELSAPEEPVTGGKPAPRPRPRPAATADPSEPAAEAAPGAAPDEVSEPRHALGIAGATASERPAAHRAPEGISGASSWGTTSGTARPAVDLSKFLEATEPHPEDDLSPEDIRRAVRVPDRARRMFVRTFVLLLIAAVATWLLRAFVVQPYYIPSSSMEPTLHGCDGCNDDHVLVDKISYKAHDVRAGDIVVFHRPPNATDITDKVLIKRVIALSGDEVQLKKGKVYVNGLVLDEPYLNKACGPDPTKPLTGTSKWQVPGNDVFVMGDNRCFSDDSRMFGPISKSLIIGRAFAIIWPLSRMRLL